MKLLVTYLSLLVSISFTQDSRSIIFNTGTPETEDGYLISGDISIADRFSASSNYAMEAFRVTMTMESESAVMTVSIHEDLNNTPGEVLGSWDITLNSDTIRDYLVYTFQDCILFDQGENYWLSVKAANDESVAKWTYSPGDFYVYSGSSDGQTSWETAAGYAGSARVYAEAFYYPPDLAGDINFDSSLNVLDIVMMISFIIGTSTPTDQEFDAADVNRDGSLDVLDVVQTISSIVNAPPMPSFSLLDFNPNSEYYNTLIGSDFFNGQVSCYYFGKQG